MPYRCDFYSDEEYEYACQMEEEACKEQLAKEEAFAQYCEEEYRKETERTLCNMKDKVYVVEMSSDDLGDMNIGYASSQAIANKMIASAESTEGFENCRFRTYQATLNQLEINDNTISFTEIKYREHPMTTEEIRANMDEDNYVHDNVLVRFSDMVGVDVEQFLDTLAEKLVGNPCLSDITYTVEGVVPEQNAIIVEVSGNVDLVLEMDDMRDQRLI